MQMREGVFEFARAAVFGPRGWGARLKDTKVAAAAGVCP
jgi:hypothetical protein